MTFTIIFFAIIAGLALWMIFMPLLHSSETNIQMILDQTTDSRKNLQSKRSGLMVTLKEMDFDYEMGKLSKEDYVYLRKKYERETIDVLKMLESDQTERDRFKTTLEKSLKEYED